MLCAIQPLLHTSNIFAVGRLCEIWMEINEGHKMNIDAKKLKN